MSLNMKSDCEFCNELQEQGKHSQPPKLSTAGKVIVGIGAGIATVVYGIAVPFILPGFRKICLPYIPASEPQIKNVIECLSKRAGRVIDLGSGDGRIIQTVMEHFRHNEGITKGEGVELNTWLVWYSRWQAKRKGFSKDKISFYKKDILKTNLSCYENIIVFGVEGLMSELEKKLDKEMASDSILIACRFPLPHWTPTCTVGEGIDKVWVYNKQNDSVGTEV